MFATVWRGLVLVMVGTGITVVCWMGTALISWQKVWKYKTI